MSRQIPLTKIRANADQPRKTFDPVALRELANSIRMNGLLQPITVRPTDDGMFEIVAGERRFRAHELLGAKTIDCNVKTMDVLTRDMSAIIENLQREDVWMMEEAAAFGR